MQSLYPGAHDIGPLATFDGGDFWVEHAYRNVVALFGDAAGTTDPSFGQEVSFSLRDERTLPDELLSNSDWDTAGHRYAERRDTYFQRCRTENPFTDNSVYQTWLHRMMLLTIIVEV